MYFITRRWKQNRKGFILLPAAGWVIIAGIVYMTAMFWAFVYDHSGSQSPVNYRDEQYDPNL